MTRIESELMTVEQALQFETAKVAGYNIEIMACVADGSDEECDMNIMVRAGSLSEQMVQVWDLYTHEFVTIDTTKFVFSPI